MDFGLLPPEVNSGRMYAGPGPGSLLTAAAAWDRLAAELTSVASAYDSVISELEAGWAGPSATAMAAAAAPYLAWMHDTAALAEQTASQVRAAVACYESAFATTVPPPAIAANRSQLRTLVAGNLLGQNTPAIAATEAAYLEMWAQDAMAMYHYAAESSGATALALFAPAPETTNPVGSGNQAAAVGQAAGGSAVTQAQNVVTGLQSAGAGAAAVQATDPALAIAYASLASSLFGALVIDSAGSFGVDSAGSFGIDFIGLDVGALMAAGPAAINPAAAGLPGAGIAPVSAMVGHSAPIGGLSVPPAWTAKAPPPVQLISASTALTAAGAEAAAEVTAAESGISFGELATAGLATRALAAAGRVRQGRCGPANRRSPLAQPGGRITRIAPELRELANLREAGILTDAEFAEQKRLLLGH